MYEGIALIQEKQAVVLDLGTDYTKFGFAGEAAPRCIIRSEFWCPVRRQMRRVHDYSTPEELYDNLVNMLHLLYFRHVLVNPKERKVVVVESLLTPTLFRETLAKVLFLHYEVSAALWADAGRLAALTLAAPAALVVCVGAVDVEVTPVLHGFVVLSALQSQPLGARAVHRELRRLLDEDNHTALHLPDDVIEDIKVKTCFVTPLSRAEAWRDGPAPTPARDVTYPAPGRDVRVSGRTRELAAEVMFARDGERASLGEMVLSAVGACAVDGRRALGANVLVCGGGAALPGLAPRLRQELRQLLREEPHAALAHVRFAFHSGGGVSAQGAAWAGGSLLGASDARALSREQFVRTRRLPDWPDLLHNDHTRS